MSISVSGPVFSHILRIGVAHALLAAAAMPLCFVASAAPQKQDGAGVVVSGEASAKDIGLPLYPGSKRHKDKDGDSASANLGLWGGGSGFKLIVLKMESADSPDKVADFYKKALAKYGPVLDCSHPMASSGDKSKNHASKDNSNKNDSTKPLSCGDDTPEKDGKLFKAGTQEFQHMVGVQPGATGTLFQIICLSNWGKDEKK